MIYYIVLVIKLLQNVIQTPRPLSLKQSGKQFEGSRYSMQSFDCSA